MEATGKLFRFLPPLDVDDPRHFMAAVASILAEYPEQVINAAVCPTGIPARSDRPTLRLVKQVCDEILEPVRREWERRAAERDARQSLPPPRRPRTPEEQARVDAQVARARRELAEAASGQART